MKKIITTIVFSFLIISCGLKKSLIDDVNRLEGKWILTKASFSDNLEEDFNNQIPYLNFTNKKGIGGNGSDGCVNDVFHLNFEMINNVKGRNVNVVVEQSTSGYRSKDSDRIDRFLEHCKKIKRNEFVNAMEKTTSYKIKKGSILIFKSKEGELIFHKE